MIQLIKEKNVLRTFYFWYAAGGTTINLGLTDDRPTKIKAQIYFENMQLGGGNSIIQLKSQMLDDNNVIFAIKGDSVSIPIWIIYEWSVDKIISDTQTFKGYLTWTGVEITQGFIVLILNFYY